MKNRIFTVILYKEDDVYIAECPEVGTVDQGETIEQAIAGLKEATRLYLEEFPLPETSPSFGDLARSFVECDRLITNSRECDRVQRNLAIKLYLQPDAKTPIAKSALP
ncbi:type II toxin-antitoxin system HicB family antitoxin [Cronbergia sp. UHCC 0137]|uniref:type II toxin-antitoxin system HicB family antitoxin n=1 Tax=Cronbergia sp. UHCC 0137 TaxID=3110239 RepID=UPI002B20C404|nr:type II toxin-antitoxin system HicB family antitoxin [Cronbergia sp. UHCC 0137]MEA5619287.1 type II toxin-antitoxin system HicB family antitoxin [Cronbergia sp. UHCC 0137]